MGNILGVPACDDHVDCHCNIFQHVVNSALAKYGTLGVDEEAPSSAGCIVAAHSKGACVRPANDIGLAGGQEIDRHSSVGYGEQLFPEL